MLKSKWCFRSQHSWEVPLGMDWDWLQEFSRKVSSLCTQASRHQRVSGEKSHQEHQWSYWKAMKRGDPWCNCRSYEAVWLSRSPKHTLTLGSLLMMCPSCTIWVLKNEKLIWVVELQINPKESYPCVPSDSCQSCAPYCSLSKAQSLLVLPKYTMY